VIVDSGFLRGTDVVKALALGARAVLLGKLQVWGLAAGGESVLQQVLDLLDHEVGETLRLLGVRGLAELTPEYVQPATPTRANVVDDAAYEHAPLPI
jgi:isopentenyl diphosphate isomerase/L-lactate dehydrogenase-like FMN-dependent dehydrogenase